MVRVTYRDLRGDVQDLRVVAAGQVQLPRLFQCPKCEEHTAWIDFGGGLRCDSCVLSEEICMHCWAQSPLRQSCEVCAGKGYLENNPPDGDLVHLFRVEYDPGEEPEDEEDEDEQDDEIATVGEMLELAGLDEYKVVSFALQECEGYGLSDKRLRTRELSNLDAWTVLMGLAKAVLDHMGDLVRVPREGDHADYEKWAMALGSEPGKSVVPSATALRPEHLPPTLKAMLESVRRELGIVGDAWPRERPNAVTLARAKVCVDVLARRGFDNTAEGLRLIVETLEDRRPNAVGKDELQ